MFKIHRRAGKSSEAPKLIVGLGNPGEKYQNTYHNVGFAFADYLANRWGQPMKQHRRDFGYCQAGNRVVVKPLSFMNQSGGIVKKALKYFNSDIAGLMVVHDDSDLELGQYKISFGRGSAGHKGVDSILKTLETDELKRIRIGIRKSHQDQPARRQAGEFVLKKMGSKDMETLEKVFLEIVTGDLEG